ncbi:hypothetical protein LTR84_002314 [Exophiala bonariae]|uniref:Uncharacterized protein n=1 Tax=Exophiala bonariae TaxID=1690606 RepID=A0AAV9NB71_9EURO|nr:hypothetical protein LTR84_002314 [Exophiala bonariae]
MNNTVGYIDRDWPNPHGPGDASIIIYGYTPSLALAIIGIASFVLLFIAILAQVFRLRAFSLIPACIACVCELIGYVFRFLSAHQDPYRISFFVGQYFCITVAPVFISASIYVGLGQLVAWASTSTTLKTGSFLSRLRPKAILWTFISADILCTALQVAGAAVVGERTSNHEDPTQANDILIAGLAAQVASFCLFLVLLAMFVWLLATNPSLDCAPGTTDRHLHRARMYTCVVSVAGILIFVRTIFRLVESAQGVFGELSSHEVYFGTLEMATVVIATVLLGIWPPKALLNAARKIDAEGEAFLLRSN